MFKGQGKVHTYYATTLFINLIGEILAPVAHWTLAKCMSVHYKYVHISLCHLNFY